MNLNTFLKADLLGKKFLAVKGYSEVLDRDTKKLTAYRLNVSVQSESSDFYMELFQVKVKILTPTVSVADLQNNKTFPVQLCDLQVGQFKEALWFSCSDVIPVTK